MRDRSTGSARCVAIMLAAAALGTGIARDASAQTCDAGIFAVSAVSPGGASARMTRSAPVFTGGVGWTLETCFVLANQGALAEPVTSSISIGIEGQPGAFYPLSGATLRPVGGAPATCQVPPGGHQLMLASIGPLPPLAISQECCVNVQSPSAPTCELLPHEQDTLNVEIDTPSQPPYLAGVALVDRDRLVSGGGVAGGSHGGGCGLTGIEFLGVPFALLALRARSGRRAGAAS